MISPLFALFPLLLWKSKQVFLFILLFPFAFVVLHFQTLFFLINEETKRSFLS